MTALDDVTMTVDDAAVLLRDILKPLHEAAGNLDTEKALARTEPNPILRAYKTGLVDGCEVTIAQVVAVCDRFLSRQAEVAS